MLTFFRRALSSWLAVALLGLIMIAFIVTGVGTPGGGIVGGPAADAVATVGGKNVTTNDIASRLDGELKQTRQQQPEATMAGLVAASGGIDRIVDQFVSGRLLEIWAQRHGMSASERLIGGEISSIPAFQGPTGAFDQAQMQRALAAQRMSFAQFHDGIRDDLVRRQLIVPISAGARAPLGLAAPYAALLIDRREGAVGYIPPRADGVPAASAADVAVWYKAHLAAYSLPERRVLRYAAIGPENVTAAAPSDAEIAAAYQADAAKYAASDTRTLSQVVLPDEAAARAFAAKAGGDFAKAAAAAGFAPADIALGTVTRDALAKTASPAVASAAFTTPAGGTTAPIKTGLGWTIIHVDAIKSNAARTLAQARGEIVAALTTKKSADALGKLVEQVQDAVDGGASFADVAQRHKLAIIVTPPLLPNGAAPNAPAFRPDATLAPLLKPAFAATADDPPTIEPIGADQRHFALLGLQSTVPAAPLPLVQVAPRIAQDIALQRAADRARALAQGMLARINGGMPVAAAFAAAGLPAPQPARATQIDLLRASQQGQPVPPPLRVLFRLSAGKSEIAPAPNGGWFLVHLDRIVPGDKALLPAIARGTQNELGTALGEEYLQQFANAARAEIKVTKNPAAIAELSRRLNGAAPAGGQ